MRNQANPATTWRLGVQEARLGYVDLYTPAPDGTGFTRQQAGRFRPSTVQDVPYRYGVFNLSLPPDQIQTMYLRVQSASPVSLPLTLWSLDAFVYHTQTDLLILGLFYGAILVMMGHSFFLFASLRDRSYLYLTLFIASFGFGLAFGDGLVHQYLWTAWPDWYGLEIAGMVAAISMLLFAMDFLDTKTQTPWLHTIMLALLATALFVLIFRFFGESNRLLNLTVLVITLITVAAGYLAWWRGYRPARYFLLAWLLFLGTLAINFLVNFGLLSRNPFDPYSLQIGIVLMMLLFSLALADRINLLKAETEQANLALTDSERRLNQFLETMPVGVAVYDARGRLNYTNQRARRLLTMSDNSAAPDESALTLDQEVARISPYVAGSEQPYPPERMPVTRALQGEATTVDDMEIRGLEQRIQLEVSSSPIFDEQQERLQYAIVAFQDITRRKEAEEALQERKERYQLALEPGQIIVWQMDVATNRWELDGAVEQIIGYTAKELGTGASLTDITHPEDLVRLGEVWQSLLEGRRERYEIVHRMFHRDGSVRWVEAQGTAVRDEHGQAIRVLGTTRDITATKQAEELVAERTAELVEANQNLQQEITERRKVEAALLAVQGQLEERVADRTAELEQANRQLATLLDVLEERVANRTRELTIFLDLTMLVSEARSLPSILETALGRILEASQCQAVCLHLPGQENETCLELVAQWGLSLEQQQRLQCLPLEDPLADWLARHHEPVLDLNLAATPLPAALRLEEFKAYLGAPLQRQGRPQGVLSYYWQNDPHSSLEEISLLAALADQLGIVVENHHLRDHIEEIAVVAERQRLARDLHDSIIQSLYSLNLFAHAGREAAEDGDADRLDDSLARVEGITLAVLKEMRLLLHQLRPLDLTEQSLAEALQIRFELGRAAAGDRD